MTKSEQLSKNGKIRERHNRDAEYTSWLHHKPCFVCNSFPVETHHIDGRKFGTDDHKQMPFCEKHHRGEFSPHGRDADKFYTKYPKSLMLTQAKLYHKEYVNG